MRDLPAGTVTFLFTDIEGSTRLLRELGDAYPEALAAHRAVLRAAVGANGGAEVDTQGDAFFFAFADAREAATAAEAAQAALSGGRVRVRMGLHTGRPQRTDEGYVGLDVHLGARVAATGHGGQVVLSSATRELLDERDSTDLGEHRLKDFDDPVWLYQLGDTQFPPLKTVSNTNLPRPASTFVGRSHELEALTGLIRASRLVTLTGPGGSGKTRLAIEAATELVGEFRNGVFWIGLAGVRDPGLVLPTIGQQLGFAVAEIGERDLLLLLDNLEQVIDVAPVLADLVESCPNLRLVVTSRELLRVRGEVEYEVLPLADADAATLFTARARVDSTPAVVELCRHLDNMPLALELAAARTKALTPEQILDRLGQRLDLFRGGRDAESRQATLRATIAWSHELLEPPEQHLFAQLGVFAGGCTIEAATAVADTDIDALQSLVEKSLLRHTDGRFWMLETIRAYALERLEESGAADETRLRHAQFFLELCETFGMSIESVLLGAEQRHDRALRELDNVRAVLAWALETGRFELAADLATRLENLWATRDPTEGGRLFDEILAHAEDLPEELVARALRCRGSNATIYGDLELGRSLYERSLAVYREIGDEAGVGVLLHRLAVESLRMDGDVKRARALAEQSLALHRAHGAVNGEAQALSLLADVAWTEGDRPAAFELLRESVALAREGGFRWWEAAVVGDLAEWALELGRIDEARAAAERSLELVGPMQSRQQTILALAVFARVAVAEGRQAAAGLVWGAIEAEERRGRVGLWEQHRDAYAAIVLASPTPEFEAARRDGARLSLDEAVEHALGKKTAPSHV